MYSSVGKKPKWKAGPIGETCLVSTLSLKAKQETGVQSPRSNVREGR